MKNVEMSGWKNKIEAAAASGRRNSVEILNRLLNGNTPIPRPHTTFSSRDDQIKRSKRVDSRGAGTVLAGRTPAAHLLKEGEAMSANIIESTTSGTSGPRHGGGEGYFSMDPTGRPITEVRNELNSLLLSATAGKKAAVIIPMSRAGSGSGAPGQGDDRGDSKLWKSHGNHSMGLVLSALYAKLLVVMGIAFPLSEVMSTYIPAAYYDGFYLYLYFGSILFMIWVFGYILRERARRSAARVLVKGMNSFRSRKNSPAAIEAPQIVPKIETTESVPQSDKSSSSGGEAEADDFSDGSSTETPPRQMVMMTARGSSGEKGNISTANKAELHHRRQKGTHFGSFYLRMGCVAFGVGSMIYSGLEFGQYFELKSDSKCHSYMQALTPSVRMIFTFMQMYFIFLSSRMAVFNESLGSQFGLMHMIGTNVCVWLNVLVQETKHEILNFYNPDNKTISFKSVRAHQQFSAGLTYPSVTHGPGDIIDAEAASNTSGITEQLYGTTIGTTYSPYHNDFHHREARGLKGPYSILECGRTNIIGGIVQDAAPFLFPCTIEYSLICAAVCYVMWKSMAKRRTEKIAHKHSMFRRAQKTYVPHRISKSPHHYTVDCAASHKGLFLGIFVLVLTIMSLIINFVLVRHPDYRDMGNLEAHVTEIVLYTMATCAVIIGMCQVRALRYSRGRNLELDNILLIVAQTGSMIFNIFAIISGQFILKKGENLVLVTALLKVIQLLLQTLFILDASKRVAATMEQAKKKPGREVVTFLLITNLAMWLINALEKSRGESHPAQLQFYGLWAWTIITHISMPLAIFYRFHSTVCLCEIWKRAYKIKH